MAYSEKLIDHYEHPRNVGTLDKNADDDAPYAWDKWITVDYDLPLLKEKHQIQPRAFCGDNSNGKGTNGSVVYYDNVYLYKK